MLLVVVVNLDCASFVQLARRHKPNQAHYRAQRITIMTAFACVCGDVFVVPLADR